MILIEKIIDCPRHGQSVVNTLPAIADKLVCPHCVEEQRLVQKAEQDRQRWQTLAHHSNIRPTSFDEWQVAGERMQAVKNFVMGYAKTPNKNLILCGSTGTGKTMLAMCIGTSLLDWGVCFIRSSDIHAKCRATWGKTDQSENQLMEYWANINLLIIDEFGEADGAVNDNMATQNRERLSRIIDGRYTKGKPTIITSNLAKDELIARLGDRAWDRLQQNAVFANCNWTSYRQSNRAYLEI